MVIVTIIMPAFNSAKHISKSLDSVIKQTFSDWELLVVDGGSIDDTVKIAKAYESRDDRIRCINNTNDQGPAHARHVGISIARGVYIAFLDADDIWLSTKLEKQIDFMSNNGILFCYTRYRIISDKEEYISCILPMRKTFSFPSILRARGIGTLTVIIHRSILTPEITSQWMRAGGEETFWWIMILKTGVIAYLLDEDLARYRDTTGSLSKNQIYTLKSVWRMYRERLGLGFLYCLYCFPLYMVDVAARRIYCRFLTYCQHNLSFVKNT